MDKTLALDDLHKWQFVALDTNVITDFYKPQYNQIANDLRRASKDRFRFVLPDICLCEAINYLEATDPILPKEWENMARNLKKFVWRKFRVLPSRNELYAILGVKERKDFQPRFTSAYAQDLFDFFCKYPSVKQREDKRRREMQDELEKVRSHWRSLIADMRREFKEKCIGHPQWPAKIAARKLLKDYQIDLNTSFDGDVNLSERRALALEYAVSLAKTQGASAYNPDSDNSRNDGIDYLIMDVIMLGVTICSEDHFIKRIRSMHSKDNSQAEKQISLCQTLGEIVKLIRQRKSEVGNGHCRHCVKAVL